MLNRKRFRQKIGALLKVLEEEFPEIEIALYYSNPLQLLMATILSAQCTDERVNQVTSSLFQKYKGAADYAGADVRALEKEIRPTGFYRNKARNMIACGRSLVENHGGEVPRTLEALVSLPGVGRKTANVILGNCFQVPAVVVDTHVKRVSRRLGLTAQDDPEKIEYDLRSLILKEQWTKASHRILLHGRRVCQSRKPLCSSCRLTSWCEYFRGL